jgi:hypothetical protein
MASWGEVLCEGKLSVNVVSSVILASHLVII